MAGKGSSPRPIPNRKQFESNWDAIFGNKDKKDQDERVPSEETEDGDSE